MKIDVNSAMIAGDSGSYTLEEAVRILKCRSGIDKRIKKRRIKWYLMAVAFVMIGLLGILVFAAEDATAGAVLILIGLAVAVGNKKGGLR